MNVSAKTTLCGVIGDPIDHTLSPAMHNAAFTKLSLDFVYLAFRVKKEQLRNAVAATRTLEIKGLNVTMPHKNAIVKHLDKIELEAKLIGAVNTVLNDEGTLVGYNTDGIGAATALKTNNIKLKGTKLLILGAGGAGKAIAYQLAQEVDELIILNRTAKKAKDLATLLHERFDGRTTGNELSSKHVKEGLIGADILINATSVGMNPTAPSLVDPRWMRPELSVMDIAYSQAETSLTRDARRAGARVISGLEMLVYQGAASFEIFTGRPAPVETMRQAIESKNGGVSKSH